MSANTKTTRFFSKPLMKQTVKSNLVLALVILVIMAGMSNVVNYAMSVMGSDTVSELSADEKTEAQQDFYTYLYAMASYDEMAQADLSYDDFASTSDKEPYETVFDLMNQQADLDLSVQGSRMRPRSWRRPAWGSTPTSSSSSTCTRWGRRRACSAETTSISRT